MAIPIPSYHDNPWIFLPPTQLHHLWQQQNILTALGEIGPSHKLTHLPLKSWSLLLLMQIYLEISTETKPSYDSFCSEDLLNHSSPHTCTLNACTQQKSSEARLLSANGDSFSLNWGFWCEEGFAEDLRASVSTYSLTTQPSPQGCVHKSQWRHRRRVCPQSAR